MSDRIPLVSVRLGEAEQKAVQDVIRSGQLAQGPKVEQLEDVFRTVAGTRHAVAVSSGTAALAAALQVLEMQPGDEVITSPLTFGATLNAIIASGATARFADIGSDFNVLPEQVAAAVTPRTRVLMPVHLYGLPADMNSIRGIAEDAGATIVEDAAQAIGAAVGDRPVGSYGLGCFSLYATKNVTTGEGGVVTTDDGTQADELRVIRNQGMRVQYEYERVGTNLRLTDLQAALGLPQLQRLDEINKTRRANASYLAEGLSGMPGLELPSVPGGRTHVFHQFTVLVRDEAGKNRDELAAALAQAGIGTGVYYPKVVFDHDVYLEHPQIETAAVPNARAAAAEVLSLPVHEHVSQKDLDTVIDAIGHLVRA